jgi:transposase
MEQVCEKCRPFVKELTRKFREQQKQINELERRLAAYENAHTPYSHRIIKPRPMQSNGKRGRPKGLPGSTRPFPKPTKTVEKKFNRCPGCNGKLKPKGQEHKIIEEAPKPQPVEVIELIANHYECDNCGEVVAKPDNWPEHGRFGIQLLAQCTVMKFEDRMTFTKLRDALKRQYDFKITPASLMNMTRSVGARLEKEHEELINKIRSSPCVYADETSLRINGINNWIWIFVTQDAVLCVIRKSRSKKVVKEILGKDYQGIVVCDGWKSYAQFGFTLQRCWAHLLREAKDLKNEKLYSMFCALFADAKNGLPRADAEKRLCRIISRRYKDTKAMKFLKKVRNGFPSWFTFLEHNVEPTNNTAENALREHVVIRKIIGGLRSEKGARVHEAVMSCFATWKKLGLNVFDMLLIRLKS